MSNPLYQGPCFPPPAGAVTVETPNGVAHASQEDANTFGRTGNRTGSVAPRKSWRGGNRSGE